MATAQQPNDPVPASSSPASGLPRLGQDPGEPGSRSAQPQVPLGDASQAQQNVFDFHGYLLLPMRVGVLKRTNPAPGQSSTALHSPPLVPQYLRSFEYTGVLPNPWAQLNISYGNSKVAATVVLAATSFTDATGLFNPSEQLGVNDAFVSINLSEPLHTPLVVRVGALNGRYGVMGAYDAGRYGTALIARTNSIGETISGSFALGKDFAIAVEQGLGGQLGRPPRGIAPAGWNDFADPNVGSSFVAHVHAGLAYAGLLQLGVHFLNAWTNDDQVTSAQRPDGRITVLGGDARLTAGRFGHFYLGAAAVSAQDSEAVSGVIEILNARGGPELRDQYLGPASGGNGSLAIVGAQYDLSLARLVYGDKFKGESPDVLVSLFGMGAGVKSDDKARDPLDGRSLYDGVQKLKGGVEATYNMLSWFGISARADHVRLNSDDPKQALTIISPRLLFHTDWQSRDEISLQYSRFFHGSKVYARTGFPPVIDPSAKRDNDVFSLSATFWW
jgi:hypothetical protein